MSRSPRCEFQITETSIDCTSLVKGIQAEEVVLRRGIVNGGELSRTEIEGVKQSVDPGIPVFGIHDRVSSEAGGVDFQAEEPGPGCPAAGDPHKVEVRGHTRVLPSCSYESIRVCYGKPG